MTNPRFCHRCQTLPLWSLNCSFTASPECLAAKALNEKCVLCNLLLDAIGDRGFSPKDVIQFARVASYLAIDDGKEQPVLNLCTLPGLDNKTLKGIQTGFSELPAAGSEAHFKVLREWIRNCDCTHDCVPKQIDFAPTRLLDISGFETNVVRLVETEDRLRQPRKYAALSHRWGSPPPIEESRTTKDIIKIFRATKGTIEELKRGIEPARLPKTFRNAVVVARGLGLDYLWVDSLCIIQDDNDDWAIESKLMEQVFSSAYCALAASCASGTDAGFLRQRPKRTCIPMTLGDATYYACEVIDDFDTHVEQSELNQRGWVMQERALSRRTIYFAKHQSYWECGGGVRCETMTMMRNRKASFLGLGGSNFPHSAEQYVKGQKIEFFQELYMRYSKLALSVATDRPFAIQGLEARLLSTFNTTGGYGILDCYLHRSLLWKRAGENLSRIGATCGEPVPSWSWMSYDGAIDYLSVPGGKVEWSKDVKSPFSGAPRSSSSCGNAEGRALEAPVRSFVEEPNKELLSLDEPSRVLAQPMECVILGSKISESSRASQTHWVLLVHRISKDATRVQMYERLGVAELDQSYIQFDNAATTCKIY